MYSKHLLLKHPHCYLRIPHNISWALTRPEWALQG